MSTQQRTYPTAASTRRRARYQSFAVDPLGGGVWTVESRGSDSTYTVMLRDGRFECDCESFNYHCIHGPRDVCKHGALIQGIVNGELCPHCTMPHCRPSCPNHGDSR